MMLFAPEGFPRLLDGRPAILKQYRGLPQAPGHVQREALAASGSFRVGSCRLVSVSVSVTDDGRVSS
jgi:hypothetical protein